MFYKAYISYNYSERKLASTLKSGLQRFTKPFHRFGAMSIFLDKSSLSVSPSLWLMSQQALHESEYFVLLASPQAAHSRWVEKEIDEWFRIKSKSTEKFLIALTDGEIIWDTETNDFDWNRTTALPKILSGKFKYEPLYVDLRWAKEEDHFSWRNPRFLEAISLIAATLHNKPKELMLREAQQSHERFKAVFTVSTILAIITSFVFLSALNIYYSPQGSNNVALNWRVEFWGISVPIIQTTLSLLTITSFGLSAYAAYGAISLRPWQGPEPVFLGASAPATVRPGEEFTARFVAYIKPLEAEVESRLRNVSPRARPYLGLKSCRWQPGTKVSVRLSCNHVIISSSEEEFIWEGQANLVEFDVEVPTDAPEAVSVLKFDALIGETLVAKLRIDIKISSKSTQKKLTLQKTEPARTAFASYASHDRPRVLDRVAEARKNGVDVFLDCLSLNPGDKWKPKLKKEIKKRQLFYLFWSPNAKASEWVEWEWRTALKYKGLSGIDPHPLVPVSEAEPPEELKDLHFNDPYMLVREATDSNRS